MVKQPRQVNELEMNLKRFFRRWNWTGARDEYFAMVKRRIGETPEDRLAWVLAQKDRLSSLRGHEHVTLADDLRACAFLALAPIGGYRVNVDDMPQGRLVGYLTEIDSGIRGLLSEPFKPWPFEAEPRVISIEGKFAIQFYGDERAGILGGIAHLIVEVGDRLRACRECGTPFVARMRQARYCSPKCSERKWNRQRTPSKKEESNG
jgi:hypothetical protein